MSEHFVKSDCLRLEFAREIIRFVSFFFVSVSRLFETFDSIMSLSAIFFTKHDTSNCHVIGIFAPNYI